VSRRVGNTVTFVLAAVLALAPCLSLASSLREVVFTFQPDRTYRHVFLAGTMNEWRPDATEMRRVDDRYEIVLPLPTGEYQYKFVADGAWITDETAESFRPDGYGGQNSVIVVDESFPPMEIARGDGRMLLDGLEHRQDAWERSLGADGSVTLRMRTWAGDVARVRLDLEGESGGGPPLALEDTDGTYDYYGVRVDPAVLGLYPSYRFVLDDGGEDVYLGPNGPTTEATAAGWYAFDVAGLAAFTTPDWVRRGVIYQIFPERFANGDPANDPDMSEWYYEGSRTLPPSGKTDGEYFHLVDDWYDVSGLTMSPYRTDGRPDWCSFYGGDLEGVRQHLDYLADLGVTAIYFNPIFEAKSNHKYDAADYRLVDPHFGSNDELARLVSECHARGIRVILDLAINHTGNTFWAFVDGREKGPESPYWSWYEWKRWPVPGEIWQTPADPLDYYDCWWGFGQMPNLNYDLSHAAGEEQTIDLLSNASPNTPVVDYLLDTAEMWITSAGVDGYRLDVAGEVPPWFWALFRDRVKQAKPDAYIVGELWGASPEWVNGRCFDAVMNYKFFRDPVLGFIARGDMTAEQFDRALAPGRLIYPRDGVLAQMNLLGSHDTERFLTAAGGDTRKLTLAMLFGMTYVGAPTIYYGDEVAMTGGGDPDCRRPFLWNWADDERRVEVHDTVRKLAGLRRDLSPLTDGDYETLLAQGRTFAFRRSDASDEIVVVMNAGESDAEVVVPLADAGLGSARPTRAGEPGAVAVELLSGRSVVVGGTEGSPTLAVAIPAFAGSVYSIRGRPSD
jgi:cyclomaltodextrinase